MTDKSKDTDILYSWKEIAKYLNVEPRTCQGWEKSYGLPVQRFTDSPKSRVFASKKDLDNWIELNNLKVNGLQKSYSKPKNPYKKYFFITLTSLIFVILFLTITIITNLIKILPSGNGANQIYDVGKLKDCQVIKNCHFDPFDTSAWIIQGNPGETWLQCPDKFYNSTVIFSGNHVGDNILKQNISIPKDATLLRWNISTTKYGKEGDQPNARVSIRYNGSYLLKSFNPPEGVPEYTIEVNIISLRGQTDFLELIHHASESWGVICSDWVSIGNIPLSLTKVDWTRINPFRNPDPPRMYTQMVYDSLNHVIILFGGSPFNDYGLNDMWSFDGKIWNPIKLSYGPNARYSHNMVYVKDGNKIILFGGENGSTLYTDTWEYDCASKTWENIMTEPVPESRAHFAMAYDSDRKKVVLFGGYSKKGDLGDTWEYDCDVNSKTYQHWQEATALNPWRSPTPRQQIGMVYDEVNKVVVLFGGVQQFHKKRGFYYNDTWEWNSKNWQNVIPHDPKKEPSPRCGYNICFDPDRDKTILYGGHYSNGTYNDVWEYDGSKKIWSKISTSKRPDLRIHNAMAYFPARKSIILFGGLLTKSKRLNDTWELRSINPN